MYGIMFRSRAMPEQFSPHEWRTLRIAFAPKARAYFHACRTARWFAPFFARSFGVRAHGYHGYTTVSRSKTRFVWDHPLASRTSPLYVVACHGRKSHGALVSCAKHLGLVRLERMKQFTPEPVGEEASYEKVAPLYAEAFAEIRVREQEFEWLAAHLPRMAITTGGMPTSGTAGNGVTAEALAGSTLPRVLDVGCGSGSLLRAFAPRVSSAVGVDTSRAMLTEARARCSAHAELDFVALDGPVLPFANASFDVVVSLLSFRYLDWDPMLSEIRRVLKPGGRLLIVDMVTVPLSLREWPRAARDKWRQLRARRRYPQFQLALRQLVKHPSWSLMLKYNPIRSEHEFRWYLESRFPSQRVELLTLGWSTRVLAFDSGPLQPGFSAPESYP
jgi:SAM-dependent methyltransferase